MTNLLLNINGTTAVLPKDFVLPIAAQSPLCGSLAGNAFSFPIRLNADANSEIFDGINQLGTPYKKDYRGIMQVCGQPLFDGLIEITCVTECDIQVVFKSRAQELCDDLQNVKTNDSLPTITFETPGSGDNFWCYILNPTTITGYFLSIGSDPYLSVGPDAATGAADLAAQMNADCPGIANSSSNQLKINKVIGQTKGFDPSLSGNDMTLQNPPEPAGDDVQADIISNIKNIQAGPANGPVAFPMLKWRNFYGTDNPKFCNIINFCVNNTSLSNEAYAKEIEIDAETTIAVPYCWWHTYIPHINLKYLVKNSIQKAGYKLLEEGFFSKPARDQLILTNNCAIDLLTDASETGTEECINSMNNVLNLNEHVPEMSAKELIEKLIENFGLYLTIKDDCVSLLCVKDVVEQAPKFLANVCTFKSIPKRFKGFKLEYDDDYDGVRCPIDQLQDYFQGLNNETFTQPFSTVCMNDECEIDTSDKGENTPVMATLRLPSYFQEGCSPETSIGTDQIGCGLLINHGIQTAADGSTYPYADTEGVDPSGNTLTDFSLNFEQTTESDEQVGLAQYIVPHRMLNYSRTLSLTACLGIETIVEILKWDKPWSVHTEYNGTFTGLIKSISFQVGEDFLSEVSIEMVSLC